jgi:hypothetical protein
MAEVNRGDIFTDRSGEQFEVVSYQEGMTYVTADNTGESEVVRPWIVRPWPEFGSPINLSNDEFADKFGVAPTPPEVKRKTPKVQSLKRAMAAKAAEEQRLSKSRKNPLQRELEDRTLPTPEEQFRTGEVINWSDTRRAYEILIDLVQLKRVTSGILNVEQAVMDAIVMLADRAEELDEETAAEVDKLRGGNADRKPSTRRGRR